MNPGRADLVSEPFPSCYAPRTCNTWIDELIGRGRFRRAACALARGCLPRPAPRAYGKLTLRSGMMGDCRLANKPLAGGRSRGHDRQEMTDLSQPGRGQYSFLMSK